MAQNCLNCIEILKREKLLPSSVTSYILTNKQKDQMMDLLNSRNESMAPETINCFETILFHNKCHGYSFPYPVIGSVEKSDDSSYKFLKRLGSGTFGDVWLAENDSGDSVAIKTFKAGEKELYKQIKEKECLQKIDKHCDEYAICLKDSYIYKGMPRLVIDYIQGADLASIIKNNTIEDRKKLGNKIISDLISGLNHIHDLGVSHQDIKEANIMYDGKSFKYVDWGLCCFFDPIQPCGSIGTLYTTSPEIYKFADKKAKIDVQKMLDSQNLTKEDIRNEYKLAFHKWSKHQPENMLQPHDIWSLGIVLLRWFTLPENTTEYYEYFKWSPRKKEKAVESLDSDLQYLILRLLTDDPTHRLEYFDDIVENLEPCNDSVVYIQEDGDEKLPQCVALKDIACKFIYSYDKSSKTFVDPKTGEFIKIKNKDAEKIKNIKC